MDHEHHLGLRTAAQMGRQDLVQMLLVSGRPAFSMCVAPNRFEAATSGMAASGHLGLVRYLVRMMQRTRQQHYLSGQDYRMILNRALQAALAWHEECSSQPPPQQQRRGKWAAPQQQQQCSHLAVISYLRQQSSGVSQGVGQGEQ
jgi:hypothetical protein